MTTDKRQLPFQFDVPRMQQEIFQYTDADWIPHFNTGYYSGDWSAIPYRSINGDPMRIFPDPTGQLEYADTIHVDKCPYIRSVIDTFECDKTAVRLLRLKAGSVIKEHKDYDLSYEDGELRLHIPIATNPQLEFYLNKERVVMQEGECWFLNFNLPHSVSNHGTTDRVHLVIDCKVNAWTDAIFLP